MKYTYAVKLDVMEERYLQNTNTNFFANDDERSKFNATLIVEADSEDESLRMRMGMSDITMWELLRIEE